MCAVLLDIWIVLTGRCRWRHPSCRGDWCLHHTCWWTVECLRRTPIVPIEGLCRSSSEPTLVAPHPGLGLGVRGCSNITLLTHLDGMLLSSHARINELAT